MRILVMGAGGVGGYFGALYARAGHEVTFVARGAHLAALRTAGLTIESGVTPLHLPSVSATDDPTAAGAVDVVMFCTKLWDVEAAGRQVAPVVARRGIVIPFQNGVESHAILQRLIGVDRVAGGVAQIAATIKAPGVIAHTGTMARLQVGAFTPALAEPVRAFAAAGQAAGVNIEAVEDIEKALWQKFAMLAALSGTTCLARQPVSVVRSDPDLRAAFAAAVREAGTVAHAKGIVLGADFVERQLGFLDGLPAEMRSSMLNDLVAGNRLEAPWLSGAVARMAQELNLAAPVSSTIYAAMKPYVNGATAR
ncbi:MAG: ketopantoate reductase family protein [Pseudomonadota bacterium]